MESSRSKSIQRYLSKLKEVRFRVSPETWEHYQEAARAQGYSSMRSFIMAAIEQKIREEERMTYVYNEAGDRIDYDAAVQLMDDEIRERLHMEMAPCSDQEFFAAYEQAHREKYGVDFVI